MKKELTKTKLNKILKKYRLELDYHEKSWKDLCKKRRSESTKEDMIMMPNIYDHEKHNSKGNQLFKNLMSEFEEYEVFP